MIGATPFCASISLLRLSQMVQILLPTEIQPNPWIFFSDKKHNWNPLVKCLQNHTFTFFCQKLARLIRRLCKCGKNTVWYLDSAATTITANTATNPGIQQCGLLLNGGKTVEIHSSQPLFHSSKNCLINFCEMSETKFSSAAPWVCDCAAGWHRDDFSKWRSSAQDCFPEVWIVGSTGNADVWGQIWLRKILLKLIDWHEPTGCWWHLVDYTWCQKSQSCFCLLLADPKTELSEKSLFWWGRLNKTVHLPPAVWDLLLPWVRL